MESVELFLGLDDIDVVIIDALVVVPGEPIVAGLFGVVARGIPARGRSRGGRFDESVRFLLVGRSGRGRRGESRGLREAGRVVVVVMLILTEMDGQGVTQAHDRVGRIDVRHGVDLCGCCR